MAQGMGVSLFVGLFQRTDDDAWSTAAAGAVASFRNPPEDGMPWVMHVDGDGYVWLEEYPVEPHGALTSRSTATSSRRSGCTTMRCSPGTR